jgi:hypothetical protein
MASAHCEREGHHLHFRPNFSCSDKLKRPPTIGSIDCLIRKSGALDLPGALPHFSVRSRFPFATHAVRLTGLFSQSRNWLFRQ